jgi:hypothetical protein
MSTGIPSEIAHMQSQSQQTAGGLSNDLGIENTNIKTAPGIELSSEQKVIVGSVLDVTIPQNQHNAAILKIPALRRPALPKEALTLGSKDPQPPLSSTTH